MAENHQGLDSWRDWKLVIDSPFAPMGLYDLRDDPQETTDLAKKEPAVFRELSAIFRQQFSGRIRPLQPANSMKRIILLFLLRAPSRHAGPNAAPQV